MSEFRVALLQMLPTDSLEGNLHKGLEWCRRAKTMGADLALFPEMWSSGYAMEQPMAALQRGAVARDGSFVQAFGELAKELEMAIAVTYLEKYDPMPRNTVTVFDRWGQEALTYAKVHTCDFGEEQNLTPGDGFFTAALDTQEGPVRIGAMICYDREFPESARVLRARAFENMLGIATCNYPYGQPDCNGHSTAFDGIAYGEIRPGVVEARDTLVIEAGEAEGIYLAAFPMDTLRDYRSQEVHGNAYRRPSKYSLLLSEAVEPPFQRQDARR